MICYEYYIKHFQLQPHPEGGFYRELYRSEEIIPEGTLKRYTGNRNISTSIYHLLRYGDISHFHRLKSDEIWYFHAGVPLIIHSILPSGEYKKQILGAKEKDISFQCVLKAGTIFGAEVSEKDGFSFFGCMVSPGFEFADFELMDRKEMLAMFPQHRELIMKFTK